MSKEFDTSWFDLKNYEGLNELDLIGWHRQIQIRSVLLWTIAEAVEHPAARQYISGYWIGIIKKNPILDPYIAKDNDLTGLFYHESSYRSLSSVNATTAYEHWMEANADFKDVWEACSMEDEDIASEEQSKLIETPMSSLYRSVGLDPGAIEHLTVDLDAPDEQLLGDFTQWLTEQRKYVTEKPPPKNFAEKNFTSWINDRLFPYIDLYIIAKCEDKIITHAKAAHLIWGDEAGNCDTVDRIKRTTKPKAEKLFTEITVSALESQIRCMTPRN